MFAAVSKFIRRKEKSTVKFAIYGAVSLNDPEICTDKSGKDRSVIPPPPSVVPAHRPVVPKIMEGNGKKKVVFVTVKSLEDLAGEIGSEFELTVRRMIQELVWLREAEHKNTGLVQAEIEDGDHTYPLNYLLSQLSAEDLDEAFRIFKAAREESLLEIFEFIGNLQKRRAALLAV